MFGKRCYDMPKQGCCSNTNRDVYQNIDIDQNYNEYNNASMNMNQMPSMGMNMGGCGCQQPIVEQQIVKCVHRTFNHTIPHVCPIKTKIINHHVYRHTYQPSYSCEEQNDVSQINEGSCCQFR